MDNKAFQNDNADAAPSPSLSHRQPFSLVRDEMEELRAKLDPGVFNAVLDQGVMTFGDKVKLGFLIAFPTVFFIMTVVLMAADA